MPVPRFRRPSRATVQAFGGGLLVALALPPWGWWPLAFVGIAMFEVSLGADPTPRQRLWRGWLFAAAWLYLGMCWMWFLTIPGYLVASAMFAGFHAVAAWAAPRGRWRVIGRPAAHTLAEALRFCFPFGGVPLASLPIGQAAGPFAGVVRIGGVLLLTWFVFQVGSALAGPSPFVPALARKRGVSASADWIGAIGLGAALAVWMVSPLADGTIGNDAKAAAPLRIAAVQGGGPQGTHAVDTPASLVFQRHLDATATIEPGTVDMVLWPENVIDVNYEPFEGSAAHAQIAAEAARLGVPFVVGITEDTPDGNSFYNAQVVVAPDGTIISRYDKVRRVPFGEYMPMRDLLHALGAPTDLVPRDATPGTTPAVLELPDGTRFACVISWEVFFGGRANEGVERGGEFIVNPTNGSSYTWTVLQSQQVASSRLRAIEQNRWVIQASPTGFSGFISPDGDVYQRTSVSEQEVVIREVPRLFYRTWYSRIGNIPWVILAAVLYAFTLWRAGTLAGLRPRPSA